MSSPSPNASAPSAEPTVLMPRPERDPVEPYRKRTRIVYTSITDEIGGADSSLYELVRNLDRTRFDPHVVLPHRGPNAARYEELGIPVHIIPIHPLHATWNPLWHLGFVARAPLRVRRIAKLLRILGPQIVHINSSVDPMAGYAARRYFDAAGEGHLVWHVRELDLRPAWVERSLFRLVARWADRVLTISKPLARRFEPMISTELVHNGVDLTRFLPRASDREGGAVIGWIGRLAPWKGVDNLLSVFREVRRALPSARLLIVAATLEHHRGYANRLREQAKQQFGDSVQWLDGTDRPEDLYQRMDLFVHLPTLREPFGRTLVEAQAAGVPVLSWPRGGIAETLDVGKTGRLVPPGDCDAAARVAIQMLNAPQSLRSMGQAAAEFARQNFSSDRYASAVQSQYAELLGND